MVDIVELVLDENADKNGIDAISIVEFPAIESNFIALKKNEKVKFAEVDKDKRILMGAALIPNKPIYRRDGDKEYYVYFSKATIRRASELFLIQGNQNNATLEHEVGLKGLSVVESWIVEDPKRDKSTLYDMEAIEGTWMVTMKVENEDVWKEYVKSGAVQGFSIEGWFIDRKRSEAEKLAEEKLASVRNIIREELESFADYPQAVRNNAKRGIELNKKVNNKCATQVGKVRAQQLAQGKPVSLDTIMRMYSYLNRAGDGYRKGKPDECQYISVLLWGGLAAQKWAETKLRKYGKID